MQKPESILENAIHKLLWDFEIHTKHLIAARRPDLVIVIEKENLPADHTVKLKESENRDKYQVLARELKKYGI